MNGRSEVPLHRRQDYVIINSDSQQFCRRAYVDLLDTASHGILKSIVDDTTAFGTGSSNERLTIWSRLDGSFVCDRYGLMIAKKEVSHNRLIYTMTAAVSLFETRWITADFDRNLLASLPHGSLLEDTTALHGHLIYVAYIAVKDIFRGLIPTRVLVDLAVAESYQRGSNGKIFAMIRDSNQEAVRTWTRCGFILDKRLYRTFEDGDAIRIYILDPQNGIYRRSAAMPAMMTV